jgi:hypothetical protein
MCHTESHRPPAEAACLAHQGPLEQEDRIRQGRREGGCWVRRHQDTIRDLRQQDTNGRVFQPRPLRAPRHRTPPQQQGQARPQARQEEARHIRPCEEKGGRDDQGHRREQEGRSLSESRADGVVLARIRHSSSGEWGMVWRIRHVILPQTPWYLIGWGFRTAE